MYTFLLVIFIIVILLLIPIILMQSGSGAQSGMLGSDFAFGVFGAKTNEVLVKITKWLIGIFMFLAFILGYIKVKEFNAYKARHVKETEELNKVESQAASSVSETTSESQTNINLPLQGK